MPAPSSEIEGCQFYLTKPNRNEVKESLNDITLRRIPPFVRPGAEIPLIGLYGLSVNHDWLG
jgi:hypothetical protein